MPQPRYPLLMFAAGFGTRMKELTRDRPKPLIKVAGKPLIDHALGWARDAGVDPIVANLHYKADMLVDHLTPLGVDTVVEAPDILETGGGLRHAMPKLGSSPVITMNPDAIWAGGNPIHLLTKVWDPDLMDALLVCVPTQNAVGHTGPGDFAADASGALRRGPGLVYGGVQIIKTDGLGQIDARAFSLNVLWDRMLARGRVHGVIYPGSWCDVGHPEGIALAENMLERAGV